ncbi:MAG: helix-turn-helix domain-containing protein [Moritella sp.]|uniref:AraC family transcriptional regulator n=1 Tax=Moritella sp. TaxID=78556 RepID=UPI001D2FDB57|nr:AraC family transcriptional regulator [Moritella sp.]NQZ50413.1 helix-turn-helix domain-containing protein [Moritella sp.]
MQPKFPVTTACLVGFSKLCQQHHVDPIRVLAASDLPPLTLKQPYKFIEQVEFSRLLNNAAIACKNDLFALELTSILMIDMIGAPGLLMSRQSTLKNIYPILAYLNCVQSLGTVFELLIGEREALHQITYSFADNIDTTQYALLSLGGAYRLFQQLYGTKIQLRHVYLKSKKHKNIKIIESFFGCDCTLGAKNNAFAFDSKLIYITPIQFVEGDLKLKKKLALLIHEFDDIEGLVEQIIICLLQDGECNKQQVANILGVHLRTFQKCLQRKGLTFRACLEQTRRKIAEEHLLNSSICVGDIAVLLGFKHAGAFIKTFVRWHGITPLQWKKQTQ